MLRTINANGVWNSELTAALVAVVCDRCNAVISCTTALCLSPVFQRLFSRCFAAGASDDAWTELCGDGAIKPDSTIWQHNNGARLALLRLENGSCELLVSFRGDEGLLALAAARADDLPGLDRDWAKAVLTTLRSTGLETFTGEEIRSALRQTIDYGEKSFVPDNKNFDKGHRGYFSGFGFAARALRFHLRMLEARS